MQNQHRLLVSRKIAWQSVEGNRQYFFSPIDDSIFVKKIFTKSFHTYAGRVQNFVASAQTFLPPYNPEQMDAFMLRNGMCEYVPQRDFINLDGQIYSTQQQKQPMNIKICSVPNLILSLKNRVSVSVSAQVQVENEDTNVQFLEQNVLSIVKRCAIFAQMVLRKSNSNEVRDIIGSFAEEIAHAIQTCTGTSRCAWFFTNPKPVKQICRYQGSSYMQKLVSQEGKCKMLDEVRKIEEKEAWDLWLMRHDEDTFQEDMLQWEQKKGHSISDLSGTEQASSKDKHLSTGLDVKGGTNKSQEITQSAKDLIPQGLKESPQIRQILSNFKPIESCKLIQVDGIILPLTVNDCSSANLGNLKQLSKNSKYLKQQFSLRNGIDIIPSYKVKNYTDNQIQLAIECATNQQIFHQILYQLFNNQFQIVIVGPQHVNNLLARSFSQYLSPNQRSSIVFSEDQLLADCEFCENKEADAAINFPMNGTQNSLSKIIQDHQKLVDKAIGKFNIDNLQNEVNNAEDQQKELNLCYSQRKCKSGCYRHMPYLISQASILCINGADSSFHPFDYYQYLEKSALIVNLCATDLSERVQFIPQSQFIHQQLQIRSAQASGNAAALQDVCSRFQARQGLFDSCTPGFFSTNLLNAHYIMSQTAYLMEVLLGFGVQNSKNTQNISANPIYFKKNNQEISTDFDLATFFESTNVLSLDQIQQGAISLSWQLQSNEAKRRAKYLYNQVGTAIMNVLMQEKWQNIDQIFGNIISYFNNGMGEVVGGQEGL